MISRFVAVFCIVLACSVTTINAEIHPDSTATIAVILEDAGCPLMGTQADTLASLRMGTGFGEIYHSLYLNLTEDQKVALIDTLGPWQGTPEWQTTPRYIHWLVIFDNYGESLRKSQIDRLKVQPADQRDDSASSVEPVESIEDILTSEQLALVLEMYENRGDN